MKLLILSRFIRKVAWDDTTDSTTCWKWCGAKSQGYGRFYDGSEQTYAHRFIYEFVNGPIPCGLFIDHLCRVTDCVNPRHLECVTNKENVRRGLRCKLRTHCQTGHEFTTNSTGWNNRGHRFCRLCVKERNKIYGKRYRMRPEAKHIKRMYAKTYNQRPDVKERHRLSQRNYMLRKRGLL